MANYTIRAVDHDLTNQVASLNDFVVEMYKPYPFDPTSDGLIDGKPNAGFMMIGDNRYYIVRPHEHGFVVNRVYTENPDEPDPVIRAWGRLEECQYFYQDDTRLQEWLENRMRHLLRTSPELRTSIRLRAFGPRRSEKFHPKISLWQSQEHRDMDRVTAMKPSRAFMVMFPELDHKQVIRLNDEYLQEFAPRSLSLRISKESKDFKLAYSGEQSPSENIDTTPSRKHSAHSCMRYDFDHLPIHPAEAYASGDFSIVIVTDQNDHIAGRCVVYHRSEDDLNPGPIYGVSEQALNMVQERLTLLGAKGYEDSCWIGARLKRVEYDYGFVAPYLDLTPQALTDNGTHLVIQSYGEIDASCYSGILSSHYTTCCECSCNLNEDDYWYSAYTDGHYCEECYNEEHIFCEYYQESVHKDDTTSCYRMDRQGYRDIIRVADRVVFDGELFVLCRDGEYWYTDDTVYSEYDDQWISPDDLDDYFQSDWDGEWYPNDQMCVTVDDHAVSRDELDNHEGIWEKDNQDKWRQVQKEMDV